MTTRLTTFGLVSLLHGGLLSAQHQAMPAGMSHEEHLRQMQKHEALKHNGALAMGFDQDTTEHHFLLLGSGGAIVVTSKDAHDAESISQIRSHLRDIAGSFAGGAFDKPVLTHGEQPPGAAIMAANRALITYSYEERPNGGSLRIETSDTGTLESIHDFLRYQIVEHNTGDPLTAPK